MSRSLAKGLSRRALLQTGALSAIAATADGAGPKEKEAEPSRRAGREIWLSCLTLAGIDAHRREDWLAQIIARMDQVAGSRPDLICLPEVFNSRYAPRPATRDAAEPIDGPTISTLARFARDKRCYIVAPITLDREGKLFNTAVLLDRQGNVAGTYDKLHPTEPEMKGGITPGRKAPVFETDFGKLGIQICFDIDWPDGWQALKQGGAELVVWPAAYPGGFPLNAFAWTHRYAIATAPWTEPAVLIDIDGHTLARSGTWEPWITTGFCLDRMLFHYDNNQKKARAIEKAYGRDVTVRWNHDANAFVLENRIPDRTLHDLIAEFGLTPLDTYLAAATKAQELARA
ncbi:MAG TPA: carbon-nitrogen hydrolase family protein [Isosphaeraceae bacterium]|jgi:hypothetical protein|nr:carbon-nitrogen hydrolase family protein [Isosphaeraceae bacterium]